MTRALGMKRAAALLAALLLNGVLFASAALLSREHAVVQDMTDPLPVGLIQLTPESAPPPPEEKEIPKPKPRPRPDFMPELSAPSPTGPSPLDISINLDPSLFADGPSSGDFIFNAGDLDHPPRAVVRTNPVYPYRARQRNIEGGVQVKLLVHADGSIGQVEILQSQPQGLFDDAVRKAVPNWKFEPGRIDGRAVPAWVVTWVKFDLSN